jgi:putative spermidine/putrescine transport system substrate-binding protein/spermidine/putrescine transport system substrate-binding protein
MPGPLNRRTFLKRAAATAAGVAAAGSIPAGIAEAASRATRSESDKQNLTLICWQGYADPSFVKPFEQKYNCKVTATYAGSSDEMVAKWIAGHGNTYDLVSASGDATRRFMNSRTLLPVDVSKLKNFDKLFPKFHAPVWNTRNGQHYGVSFTWGPDVLIYDTRVFKNAPTSWHVIYDPAYKGKLSTADNPITIADVALYLGFKDCYNLTDAQLAKCKAQLQEQKPLLRKYWGGSGDLEDAFIHREVVASNAWPLMTNDLRKAHYPIGETIPREGATGWADTWMISKNSPNVDLAMKWIDYMIGPQGQKGVIDVTAYSGASRTAIPLLGPARVKALHMNDLAFFDQLHMWAEPANYAKWQQIWNDVKA